MIKVLVCGSRGKFKDYRQLVFDTLGSMSDIQIIEGCCKNSADEYAEEYASKNGIKIYHHSAEDGKHLKRNIEMISKCDLVLAFYSGFSYGTAQTIAQAVMNRKEVRIVEIKKESGDLHLKHFIEAVHEST